MQTGEDTPTHDGDEDLDQIATAAFAAAHGVSVDHLDSAADEHGIAAVRQVLATWSRIDPEQARSPHARMARLLKHRARVIEQRDAAHIRIAALEAENSRLRDDPMP